MRLTCRCSRSPHPMHDLCKAAFSFLAPRSGYDFVHSDGVKAVKRAASVVAEEAAELGFVERTRGLERKRIGISNNGEASPCDTYPDTPLKKQRSGRLIWDSEASVFEALPLEILIKIVCGADHDDLKQFFQVSKAVREATLIAKQCHFAYTTPSKTPRVFGKSIDVPDLDCNLDTPNAPKRKTALPSRKMVADIAANLFAEWDFSHLEEEFDAGIFHHAISHGNKNVYLFGTTELQKSKKQWT